MKIFIGLLLLVLLLFQAIMLFDISWNFIPLPPIKVGVVYSTTGFRAPKEWPVKESTLMAIEEINQKGGINGRKLIPIIKDAQSNWQTTLEKVEELINKDQVNVIFGCWMSGNRIDIKQLFEKYNNLLISPFQYEGIIDSKNMLFVGITPNQQIPPTIDYCFRHFGKRLLLIGSDYVFPHIANRMIEDQVEAKEGSILGEIYIPLGSKDMDEVIQTVIKTKPDAILCSILGHDNQLFFRKLREAGIKPEDIPVFSLTLTEIVLANVDNLKDFVGNYATWCYFQSIDTPMNHTFINKFSKFAKYQLSDNAVESGYIAPFLWARAASEAYSIDPDDVKTALQGMRLEAPEGYVTMTMSGQYAWKFSRIGKIRPNGQFEIIWESQYPIRPIPFQLYRSKMEWEKFLQNLFEENSTMNTGQIDILMKEG